MKPTIVMLAALAAVCLGGCSSDFTNIPPNAVGMILTPTGYDGKVLTPGQVDIGIVNTTTGASNTLVLVQRSGTAIKESFAGPAANADHEDHRCLTGDRAPATVDVRMLLALPEPGTKNGDADFQRLLLLGNPVADKNQKRTQWVSAESVYIDQAQQQARGRIRQTCAQYKNFEALLDAFADEGPNGLTHRVETAVAQTLAEAKIPLHIVNATVSNLKPDPSVTDAIAARLAAEKRKEAIQVITDFIAGDPSGSRLKVYSLNVIQEIIAKGGDNGHNTIFMTDVASPAMFLPAQK